MKQIYTILLILTVLLMSSCNKNTAIQDKEHNGVKENPVFSKVILEINQHRYTNNDYLAFLQTQYPDLSTITNSTSVGINFLNSFIDNKILLLATDSKNITIEPSEIQQYLKSVPIDNNSLNIKQLTESTKIQKFLYFFVYQGIKVSDKEIQQYYLNNLDEFRKKEEVFLHQILLKNREEALNIRGNLLNNPEKFAVLAKEKSKSVEAKDNGVMGYFERGTLPREIENIVFSLKINEISQFFESPYGFHIFKITKRKKKRLLFLSSIKLQIKNKLLSIKMNNAYNDYLDNLKSGLTIKVNYQNLFLHNLPKQGELINENS